TRLTGEEFFLKDHVIQGQRVVPGVAYLEMARAAVERALELRGAEGAWRRVRLEDVVWVEPLVVGEGGVEVHIALIPEETGAISFEVYTGGGDGCEERVHAHGRAEVEEEGAAEAPPIDLLALRGQCEEEHSAERCYEAFARMGMVYGPGLRSVERLRVGSEAVVAELRLPEAVRGSEGEYVLHPSLMDGALQASVGFVLGAEAFPGERPVVEFALERLE